MQLSKRLGQDDKPLRRFAPYSSVQLREKETDDGEPRLGFVGHAAVFNQRTYIGIPPWGWFEQIEKGAFEPVLKDDVRMLKNHNPDYLLARTTSGTLRLSEDDVGLVSDADMAPVTYARDLSILIERGDLSQMSFAFWPAAWDEDTIEVKDEETGEKLSADLVTITKMERLYDVSPVTYPAYEGTDANVRAKFGTPIRSAMDESRIARAILKRRELEEMELRAIELRPQPYLLGVSDKR